MHNAQPSLHFATTLGFMTAGTVWRDAGGRAMAATLRDGLPAVVWPGRSGLMWRWGDEVGRSRLPSRIETCRWLSEQAALAVRIREAGGHAA